MFHLYGCRRCPHQHPPTRRLDSIVREKMEVKKASLGFVVTWSESQLSLVSCPSSPSEIIEETAESGFNDKTLPHEEQSEVPDGRGSAPSKRQTIDTRTTSLYTSTILALSTGVTPTAKRRFARLFTRCLSRHTFTLLCIHTITQLRIYAFTYNCCFCTEDFSCVDTIFSFCNHTLFIVTYS